MKFQIEINKREDTDIFMMAYVIISFIFFTGLAIIIGIFSRSFLWFIFSLTISFLGCMWISIFISKLRFKRLR